MESIHLISVVFIIFYLLQAFFYLRYFLPFLKPENAKYNTVIKQEGVSVVICAHNELENLKNHLSKFLNQNYNQFEVIVVNDRSEDGSADWLTNQEKQNAKLKVIEISKTAKAFNPKKYALTKGIEKAEHDIILLSDADCEPASEHWIDRMSQPFVESTTIVLGASLYKKKKGLLNQFIRFETLQTALLYLSFAFKAEPYMGVGRNLAYRKSFFVQKKGFSKIESVLGGDDDLWVNMNANNINTAICTHPDSLTFSNPKQNWTAFFKQKKRHLSVGKFYKPKDKFKLGLFHLSQSMLWILFILGCLLGNPLDCLILSFLFVIYLVGQYVVFYKLSIKFGNKELHIKNPLLEILFIGYYWIWGIYATLTKHLTWK